MHSGTFYTIILLITDFFFFALLYLSLSEALLMYFVRLLPLLESKVHNDRDLICLFVTLSPVPL